MTNKYRYSGKLGAGNIWSRKPVILFDDFEGTCNEFDTVLEAVDMRQKESETDRWAVLKMIFRFDESKSEYELLSGEAISQPRSLTEQVPTAFSR